MAITNERALELYYAINLHFTSNTYNVLGNNYRVTGLNQREDYYRNLKIIWKLVKVYHNESQIKSFFIYCMLNNKKNLFDIINRFFTNLRDGFPLFYEEMTNPDATFEKDMLHICNQYGSLNSTLKSFDGGKPKILDIVLQKEVNYLTIIILDSLVGLISRIDKIASMDTLWSKERHKIKKLSIFLPDIDKEVFLNIINKVRNNNT